ncbi:hypothetical protein ACHAWU_003222 [Discostella pseudostelligera]|uniref:Protein ENHANCED DISEASE RESISTANCE 2 C-terminal domain-containing protein n=1 Tax=Discostella pseudostelligera TaxID=259834 RepID=A0ABD3N471_9STRA
MTAFIKKKHDAAATASAAAAFEELEGCSKNLLLHTTLFRGHLSVTTHDVDIRRQEDLSSLGLAGALSNLISIETDYILQIADSSTTSGATTTNDKSVRFDKSCKSGSDYNNQEPITDQGDADADADAPLPKMETYHCSKRYVDVRNLANSLRSHAEDIVKYYASSTNTSSSSSKETLYGTVEKLLTKPIEVVQFLTNTESNTSNLVSTLDSISKKGDSNKNNPTSTTATSRRRTSEILHKGSPFYIRFVLLGVDRFYEAIYSERRQFSKKTNLEYVTKVAERRRGIIDMAFSQLMQALSCADLVSLQNSGSSSSFGSIPVPLEKLIGTLEKFLLTDVVLDCVEDSGTMTTTAATTTSKEAGKMSDRPQDEPASAEEESNASIVRPMSTTRRASIVDRTEEMRMLFQEAASNLVLSELQSDDEEAIETNNNTGVEAANDTKVSGAVVHGLGVLPDHPTDFAILVAIGSMLFKVLDGHVLSVPLDILLAFGIVCGLVGYQLAQQQMSVDHLLLLQKGNDDDYVTFASEVYDATQYHSQPSSGDETSTSTELFSRRSSFFTPSTTSTSDSLSVIPQQNPKSLRLLRKSISNFKALVIGEEDKSCIRAAKTFPQFPDGSAIGSHLNCWSSPPSINFHVRGPNYLKDKEKVPSDQYLFPCRGCDLFLTDTAPTNVGRNRSILGGKLRDVPTFIINYRLPWGVFLSYHEIPSRFLPFLRRGQGYGDLTTPLPSMANMTGGERALCNFLLSSAAEKNQVFKIIPMVVEGPWVVKRVVGGKPAIIGKKLPIAYVYQPPEEQPHGGFLSEYLEADLDIVSSAAARNILAVVRSYTQVLTIDLGLVVQGNTEEELPEQMMLGLRLHGLDPLTAELLPVLEDGTTMLELDNEE